MGIQIPEVFGGTVREHSLQLSLSTVDSSIEISSLHVDFLRVVLSANQFFLMDILLSYVISQISLLLLSILCQLICEIKVVRGVLGERVDVGRGSSTVSRYFEHQQ